VSVNVFTEEHFWVMCYVIIPILLRSVLILSIKRKYVNCSYKNTSVCQHNCLLQEHFLFISEISVCFNLYRSSAGKNMRGQWWTFWVSISLKDICSLHLFVNCIIVLKATKNRLDDMQCKNFISFLCASFMWI